MERQPDTTGAALERIAFTLERIGGLLEELTARLRPHPRTHTACQRALHRAVWRRRTVRSGIEEPPSAPLRPLWTRAAFRVSRFLTAQARARRQRPWLGLVGVALAVTAVVLVGQLWLLLSLALCAWWWCPASWRWTWLIPLGAGLVGVVWATVGSALLAVFPLSAAGLLWGASAVGLAALGAVVRDVVRNRLGGL